MKQFGHEKLDVYRLSLQYVAYAYSLSDRLKGHHRHARDQLLRASQSIPLNIAEGNGGAFLKLRVVRHWNVPLFRMYWKLVLP